jgi:hypothetical protein
MFSRRLPRRLRPPGRPIAGAIITPVSHAIEVSADGSRATVVVEFPAFRIENVSTCSHLRVGASRPTVAALGVMGAVEWLSKIRSLRGAASSGAQLGVAPLQGAVPARETAPLEEAPLRDRYALLAVHSVSEYAAWASSAMSRTRHWVPAHAEPGGTVPAAGIAEASGATGPCQHDGGVRTAGLQDHGPYVKANDCAHFQPERQ